MTKKKHTVAVDPKSWFGPTRALSVRKVGLRVWVRVEGVEFLEHGSKIAR